MAAATRLTLLEPDRDRGPRRPRGATAPTRATTWAASGSARSARWRASTARPAATARRGPARAAPIAGGAGGGSSMCPRADVSGGGGGGAECPDLTSACVNGSGMPCGNAGCTDFTDGSGVCDSPAARACGHARTRLRSRDAAARRACRRRADLRGADQPRPVRVLRRQSVACRARRRRRRRRARWRGRGRPGVRRDRAAGPRQRPGRGRWWR